MFAPGRCGRRTRPTPDPCNSAGNFGGGWCQTAHSVAANVFGWNFSAGGHGAIIGMVDTGIDLNSPEFLDGRGVRAFCRAIASSARSIPARATDAIGGDDTVFPGGDSTHGTHTTGIAAGLNVGIAYAGFDPSGESLRLECRFLHRCRSGHRLGLAARREHHQRVDRRTGSCAERHHKFPDSGGQRLAARGRCRQFRQQGSCRAAFSAAQRFRMASAAR